MPPNNTRTPLLRTRILLARRFAVAAGRASAYPPSNAACISFNEAGRKLFIVWDTQFTEEFAALQEEIKQGVQHRPKHEYATRTTAERSPDGYTIVMAYVATESW